MLQMLRSVARQLAKRINFSRRVQVQGVRLTIPRIYGLSANISEPWMIGVLSRLLPRFPGRFVDVGVNVGQTLLKLKVVDRNRDYVGFEPNPACVFYVQQLIAANSFPNCTLVPVGIFTSDRVLHLNFFSDSVVGSSASLIQNFRPTETVDHRASVPVFRFNHLGEEVTAGPIGILKIDVEGAEQEVLESMADVIDRDEPAILIEMLPVYTADNTDRLGRQRSIEAFIRQRGYRIFRITKTDRSGFEGFAPVAEFGIHSDLQQCDYVLVPGQMAAGL